MVGLAELDGLAVWAGNSRAHDEGALEELTASVRASGVLEPLLARTLADGRLEIVCGRRRMEAAKRAGSRNVPVYVRDMTDRDAALAAAAENMQREDLSPLECGEAVGPVVAACGGDVEAAAELLGRPAAWTRRALSLKNLSAWWRGVADGAGLSFAFLAAVARLPEDLQERLGLEMGPRLAEGGGDLKTLAAVTGSLLADIPACAWMSGDKACGRCAKRSDLQAELFDDMGPAARCLDPVCREEKRLAYVSAKQAEAAKKAGCGVQDVATTDWAKATDSRKRTRPDMVPVVVDKGTESGTVVWRDPPKIREKGRSSGAVDATPKGPTPEQRRQAAYVKATVAELSSPGRLAEWADDLTAGKASGFGKVLAACVLFGVAADDAETAERGREVLDRVAEGKDTVWAGRLAEGIRLKLAFRGAADSACAYAWAELARRVFGYGKAR